MKLVIDIPEEQFKTVNFIAHNAQHWRDKLTLEQIIATGEPIKIGHWIKEKSIHGWDGKSYQCSECGRSIHLDSDVEDLTDYPYCHCSAEMIKSDVAVGEPYDEDYISRQAVLATLDNMDKALDEDRTVENYKELLKECYKVLTPVNPNKTIERR
jgi:hypothetical protein